MALYLDARDVTVQRPFCADSGLAPTQGHGHGTAVALGASFAKLWRSQCPLRYRTVLLGRGQGGPPRPRTPDRGTVAVGPEHIGPARTPHTTP